MFGGCCVEFRYSRTVSVQVNWMESIGKVGSVFYIIIHGMEIVPRNKRLFMCSRHTTVNLQRSGIR
jgi:hypothetical protein